MKKYYLSFIVLFLASLSCAVVIAGPTNITLHKQAGCMCCDAHADVLEKQGFQKENSIMSINNGNRIPFCLPSVASGLNTSLPLQGEEKTGGK